MFDAGDLLRPVSEDLPGGENLMYDPVFDDIREARRADDQLNQGDWQHEVKTSDWQSVLTLCRDALTSRTKDLQVAVWMLEALTAIRGFEGVSIGLKVISGLLEEFWDHLYPAMEDDDIEYRVGPLEFMNDKLWLLLKKIPLTDSRTGPVYTLLDYEESRQVGFEKEMRNAFGDVDVDRKKARDELIREGKLSAEEFEAAVRTSPRSFYDPLFQDIASCIRHLDILDAVVDDRYGRSAPRLADFRATLEEEHRLVARIVEEKRIQEPDDPEDGDPDPSGADTDAGTDDGESPDEEESGPAVPDSAVPGSFHVNRLLGGAGIEETVWKNAVKLLRKHGIKPALEQLLGAAFSAQSVREKTNFRLLIARLCLKAERPDLARPVIEELTLLIENLKLEQWESPVWIAEALGTLYLCLTAPGSSDPDRQKAAEILPRLCTLDITRAMDYSIIERSR